MNHSLPGRPFVLSMVVAISVAGGAAQAQDDTPAPRAATATRVYDIRDLLVHIPRFTGAPTMARGDLTTLTDNQLVESLTAPSSVPTRQEVIEQLVTLIQDTVGRQGEWAAYGGDVSRLRELNGNLVVQTTPANQKQIELLLAGLRATSATQVSIDAYVLRIPTSKLEKFKSDHTGGAQIMTPQAAAKLVAMLAGGDDDVQVMATCRLLCFNGQRVHAAGFRQATFVSNASPRDNHDRGHDDDAEPTKGVAPNDEQRHPDAPERNRTDERPPAGKPTLSIYNQGVVFDVEVTLSHDLRRAIMTFRSQIAIGEIERTLPSGVEAPSLADAEIRTSVSVTDKGGVLLGAVTQQLRGGQPADDREILLFVRPQVVHADEPK